MENIVKIKKVSEVGEMPFQFIEKVESILQGWDVTINKTIYLFKTDTGKWGYWDKNRSRIVEINNWEGKSAWIEDHFVKMGLYHRVLLKFQSPLNYTGWDNEKRKEVPSVTDQAIVVITDTTYNQILEQLKGRAEDSFLKFEFTSKNLKSKNSSYVNKVIWVS